MLRFLFDENFDRRIVRGLKLRLSQLDYVIVQQAGMGGFSDPALLEWAANEDRIMITHDVNTIPHWANERIKQALPMTGVIIVPDDMEIGRAIADLEVVFECAVANDLANQIQYLPL